MIELFNINEKVTYLMIPSWSIGFVTSQTYASILSTFQNCLLQIPLLEISSADSEIFFSMTFLGKDRSCRKPNLDETRTDRTDWWKFFSFPKAHRRHDEWAIKIFKMAGYILVFYSILRYSSISQFPLIETCTHSRFLSLLILTVPQEHDFVSRDFWPTLTFQ